MIIRLCLLIALCVAPSVVFAQAPETVILAEPVYVSASADPSIFPKSWRSSRINAQAEPLADQEIERSKTVLKAAFKKYPTDVLTANLDSVYVVHRLKYFGISASGTNSRMNVYLANRGIRGGFTDKWIERVFHAEFSSILLRNFPSELDTDVWNASNGAGFEYGASGVQAVRNGEARTRFDAQLHDAGFLYQYAQSTLENDFNSIAAQLFLGDPSFWAIVKEHGRIRRKVNLVIGFYNKLDPSLDQAFFEAIARQK